MSPIEPDYKRQTSIGVGFPKSAMWCNGSTTDFGSVSSGSSPLLATEENSDLR